MREGVAQVEVHVAEGPRLQVLLFVSYEDSEGRNLAVRAKHRFETAGHSAWVWCLDAASGAYTHEEISERIRTCDRVIYICTRTSHESKGQQYERAQALTWDKLIDVIAFDLDEISGEIPHANASIINPAAFDDTCALLADEMAHSPVPSIGHAVRREDESLWVDDSGLGIDRVSLTRGEPVEPA